MGEQSPAYKVLRNKVNRLAKSLKSRYHKSEIDNLCSENNRKWWQIIKRLGGIRCRDNSIETLANHLTFRDLQELAEVANSFFICVTDGLTRLTPQDSNNQVIPDKYCKICVIPCGLPLRLMETNLCLITAGIVLAINNYTLLP